MNFCYTGILVSVHRGMWISGTAERAGSLGKMDVQATIFIFLNNMDIFFAVLLDVTNSLMGKLQSNKRDGIHERKNGWFKWHTFS